MFVIFENILTTLVPFSNKSFLESAYLDPLFDWTT